jgi:hypothetical protein
MPHGTQIPAQSTGAKACANCIETEATHANLRATRVKNQLSTTEHYGVNEYRRHLKRFGPPAQGDMKLHG